MQPVVSADGLDLGQEEDWGALPRADDEAVAQWWTGELEERVHATDSDGSDQTGALFELDAHRPDVTVLGSAAGQMLHEIENMPEVERLVTNLTTNPDWAALEQEKQGAFEAGRLMRHREFWLSICADAEVARWSQEGYSVKISEADERCLAQEGLFCRGLRKRNGKKAMENLSDFRRLLMQQFIKGTYEVCLEADVENVLPLNVADKPGKDPPFRLIHNYIPFNPFVQLWSVRYEGLRTVPLVVSKVDWLFSVDFQMLTTSCYCQRRRSVYLEVQ